MRFGVEAFLAVPGLIWVAMLGTLAACVALYRGLARASRAALEETEVPAQAAASSAQDPGARREVRAVGADVRALGVRRAGVPGAVFQGAGAHLRQHLDRRPTRCWRPTWAAWRWGPGWAGVLAARRTDALKLYAYCELGIGLYCVATPWIFQGIQALYVALAAGSPADAAGLTVLRVLLGAAALSVPTVLMGMTLPILARFFEHRSASLGASVALLYGANTVGAACGALLAGYLVIPALGMFKTTLSTALLNLVVAALALRLFEQLPAETTVATPAAHPAASADPGAHAPRAARAARACAGRRGDPRPRGELHPPACGGRRQQRLRVLADAVCLSARARRGGAEIARWLLSSRAPLAAVRSAWLEFALAAACCSGCTCGTLPDYFASFAYYPLARGLRHARS